MKCLSLRTTAVQSLINSVSKLTGYRLDNWNLIPGRGIIFQTGSGYKASGM
jgi:hypothetical protein